MKVIIKEKNIKKQLTLNNLSQNKFARQLKTTSGYVSQLITGVRNPSAEMREKILNVLPSCAFHDLFRIID